MDVQTTEKPRTSQSKPKPAVAAAEKDGIKRERFVAGAESRTTNAIRSIRLIGKLANSSRFTYKEEDVRKITNALAREVDSLKMRMTETSSASSDGFRLR